jgi:hypothetical protein
MKYRSHAEPQSRREVKPLHCVLCASASLRELLFKHGVTAGAANGAAA